MFRTGVAFTFPVGTCVTGTTDLALHTGSTLLTAAAGVFYLALVGAWLSSPSAPRTAASVDGCSYRPRQRRPQRNQPAPDTRHSPRLNPSTSWEGWLDRDGR